VDFYPTGGYIFLLLLFALFCAAAGDEFKKRRQELLGR
jgi:hypothetical protein